MKKTSEHPHCLTAGTAPGLMDSFKKNNEILEGIAKGLDAFLEVSAPFRTGAMFTEGTSKFESAAVVTGTHQPVRRPEFLGR